ncbi:endonuclease/exonuclease/phosphatase family protein [Pseudoruegeria sp. HB172150]|uniref:endonuclease/exonuclease/phosphatase family protein n=1 Tax=Pseudoruegeria sp. HB172150 TaxID=2721164 RepID=UPI0015559137|nr:endonuclease/exonuclease/phosphatase family protein [Pseudoruegeria sp. HB172150]
MQRRGPGLLLRDLLQGEAEDVASVVGTVAEMSPDILLLTGFDWDAGLTAAGALVGRLAEAGAAYPYRFAMRPNSGMATGLDMDGDGRLGGPRDAQGYGNFAGQGGMLLLSRLQVQEDRVRDFSTLLWTELPGALLPEADGKPFPSIEALEVQRLSQTGHWDVPVVLPSGAILNLLCFAAGPPVFDGPEDRNGKRNHDEATLWVHYLDGSLDDQPPETPVVVMGNANLDPEDGDGLHEGVGGLLRHDRLRDPGPVSAGGAEAAALQGGANAGHRGDPALDTADWSDESGPGNLRVSYVLPDAALKVAASGVFWPVTDDPLRPLVEGEDVPRHRMVWVDLAF